MRFAVLGSGSKGNAIVVQSGDTTILVDVGLSPKQIKHRLASLDLALADLTALCVTHAHGDHYKGAPKIAAAFRLRTYATRGTQRALARRGGLENFVEIGFGERHQIGALYVHAFATHHDAPGSCGFTIDDGMHRLGYCTDTGKVIAPVAEGLADCDSLVLEFNHDVGMVQEGPYPPNLKRRVLGDRGHLSNEQARDLLRSIGKKPLRRVLLAHLSETNNLPRLALAAARAALEERPEVEVSVAPQHHATGWLRVGVGKPLRVFPPVFVSRGEEEERIRTPAAGRRAQRSSLTGAQKRSVALKRQLTLFGG